MEKLKIYDKVIVNAKFVNKSTNGVENKTFNTYTSFNNYLIKNRGKKVLLAVNYEE